MTVEELLAESECRELLLRYGRAQDDMDGAQMRGLFAAGAVMNLVDGPRIEGGPAIERFWDDFFATPRPSVALHIFSNIRFRMAGAETARGSAYVAVHRYLPGEPVTSLAPVMVGEARLGYALTQGGWRIALYELEVTTLDGYVHGRG